MAPSTTGTGTLVIAIEVIEGLEDVVDVDIDGIDPNQPIIDVSQSICCIISAADYHTFMAMDLFYIELIEEIGDEVMVELCCLEEPSIGMDDVATFNSQKVAFLRYAFTTYPFLEDICPIQLL